MVVRVGHHSLLALPSPQNRDVQNRDTLCPRPPRLVRLYLLKSSGTLLGAPADRTNVRMNDHFLPWKRGLLRVCPSHHPLAPDVAHRRRRASQVRETRAWKVERAVGGGLIAMNDGLKERPVEMVVTMVVVKVKATQGREVRGVRETLNVTRMATGTEKEGATAMASGSAYATVTGRGSVSHTRKRSLAANVNANANGSVIETVTVTDTGIGIVRMRRIATAGRIVMLPVSLRR